MDLLTWITRKVDKYDENPVKLWQISRYKNWLIRELNNANAIWHERVRGCLFLSFSNRKSNTILKHLCWKQKEAFAAMPNEKREKKNTNSNVVHAATEIADVRVNMYLKRRNKHIALRTHSMVFISINTHLIFISTSIKNICWFFRMKINILSWFCFSFSVDCFFAMWCAQCK